MKRIADALEPERSKMKQISNKYTEDFFFLVNNLDIRHNNCNPADTSNYNPIFDKLSSGEKEKWYDIVYEQALALYVLREQQIRNGKISELKAKMSGKSFNIN